jgi:hypothetical protein
MKLTNSRISHTPSFGRLAVPTRLAVLIVLAACGGGEEGPPPLAVEDMLGRSCEIAVGNEVTCDEEPKPAAGCPSGETACFQVGTTGDAAGPGAICAACCKGNTSRSVASDCSNLVCSSAEDCPPQYGRCVSNMCRY